LRIDLLAVSPNIAALTQTICDGEWSTSTNLCVIPPLWAEWCSVLYMQGMCVGSSTMPLTYRTSCLILSSSFYSSWFWSAWD